MSKRKENPPLADWEVTLADSKDPVTVPASWWRVKGGHYRFYGETGVVHDFAPWTVTHVRRMDRAAVEHADTGLIVPNVIQGGMISECRCGQQFAGVSAGQARELITQHVRNPDGEYSEAAS